MKNIIAEFKILFDASGKYLSLCHSLIGNIIKMFLSGK